MGALSGFEILVICDSAEPTAQLRRLLEHDSALVTEARTARSALAAALETMPHLILCDLSLIGQGAFAFLAEAKRQPALARIPILALGTARDRDGVLQAKRMGADDCLLKPLAAGPLVQKVERLVRQSPFEARLLSPAGSLTATVASEIVRAGEGGLTVEAPVWLGADSEIRVESPLLKQIGLAQAITRSANRAGTSQPAAGSGYLNEVNLLGVDFKTARIVRSYVSGKPSDGGSSL